MKIIVLAGGADQAALIIELKKRGHYIILIDYLNNPPGKLFADKHIEASTLDIDTIKEIAIKEKVDLVTTACTDQALLSIAKISEDLNLPCYLSYQSALNVTNKLYMKKKLSDNDIPTGRFIISDGTIPDDINISFPVVVKPIDCNSSKGVKKAYKENELNIYLDSALSLSRSKIAIIEEYKEGEEISADLYIENEKAKLLLVTGTYKIPNLNSFTIIQSHYPVVNEKEELEILKIAQKIADVFELINTPLLVQLIKSNNNFYVIEFSARIGGGSKYKIIERLSGVNIMNVYIDLILGIIPTVSPEKKSNYALMNYIYCNPGIIAEIQKLETLKKENIIDEFFYYKTIGMEIDKSETSSDRAAGFFIMDNDKLQISSKLQIADENIKIIDQNGNDIMKHGLYVC